MAQFRLTWLLFTPSLFSSALLVVITCLFVATGIWGYLSDSDIFESYLFGPSGLATALLTAPDLSSLLSSAVFRSPITYGVIIFAAAIIIGFLVFEVLEGSRRVVRQSSVLWYRLHSPHEGLKAASQATLARLGVRITAIFGWMLYILIFLTIIMPFCAALFELGVGNILTNSAWGWVFSSCATALFAGCVHLHIVFLRLVLLRPRILGGIDIEMAILN